jgi:hypothetical protein
MRAQISALEAPAREKLEAIGMQKVLIDEFIETAILLCDNAAEFVDVCHVYYSYVFYEMPPAEKKAHYQLYYKRHHSKEFLERYEPTTSTSSHNPRVSYRYH